MTQVALIKSKNGTSEELVRFSQDVEQLEKWVAKVNEENKAFGISQYFRIAYNEQDKFFTGAAQQGSFKIIYMEIQSEITVKIDSEKIKQLIKWHIKCEQIQNTELKGEVLVSNIKLEVNHIDDFLTNGDSSIFATIKITR